MEKAISNYKDSLSYYTIANFIKDYINENTVIVCIGSDRCIGDSLGPLVGTLLKESFFPLPVYGTISTPIHALNINKELKTILSIHKSTNIIGIDACLGDKGNIGEIQARNFSVHPGKGVGKLLPEVGSVSIIGIVDASDGSELFTNRNIRLDLILNMSKNICHSLIHGYYLSNKLKQNGDKNI